jgi:hypothetical protein
MNGVFQSERKGATMLRGFAGVAPGFCPEWSGEGSVPAAFLAFQARRNAMRNTAFLVATWLTVEDPQTTLN